MPYAPFQRYLQTTYRSPRTGRPLVPTAASDYASNMRKVERLLGQALDHSTPTELRDLADRGDLLRAWQSAGTPLNVVQNLVSALRAYAHFRDDGITNPPPTQAETLAMARLGQGRFRDDLLRYWQARCPLTGVTTPTLLRASHIKAWSESDDTERLDPFNGLLLAVHLDALFDAAIISFSASGALLVSSRLPALEQALFGLAGTTKTLELHPRHQGYMEQHRARHRALA